VANQTLRAEYQALAAELTLLRAQYEKLDRALTSAKSGYEELRDGVGDANARTERALAAVGETRAVIDDVGGAALGVARRLSAVAKRYPRAGRSVKKALRAGLDLKRSAAKSRS
jgi:chromosome segregation ATPase